MIIVVVVIIIIYQYVGYHYLTLVYYYFAQYICSFSEFIFLSYGEIVLFVCGAL